MRIIARKRLREFAARYAVARAALENWERVVRAAVWKRFVDVRATYRSADRVVLPRGNVITVFDIGAYRLLTYVNYEAEIVYIKEFLTHAEYDRGAWKTTLDHD